MYNLYTASYISFTNICTHYIRHILSGITTISVHTTDRHLFNVTKQPLRIYATSSLIINATNTVSFQIMVPEDVFLITLLQDGIEMLLKKADRLSVFSLGNPKVVLISVFITCWHFFGSDRKCSSKLESIN